MTSKPSPAWSLDGPSYFASFNTREPPRSERSTPSTPLSPLSHPRDAASSSDVGRPGQRQRPQSEPDEIYMRARVSTIEEDIASSSTRPRLKRHRQYASEETGRTKSSKSPMESPSSPTVTLRPLSDLHLPANSQSEDSESSDNQSSSQALRSSLGGHKWSRRSGASSRGPKTNKSSESSERRFFSRSSPKSSRKSEPQIAAPIPLRPPMIRRISSGPNSLYPVTVETSFQDSKKETQQESSSPEPSRRSSLRAKAILTAPLVFLRKLSGPKTKESLKDKEPELMSLQLQAADHETSQKRMQTAAALDEVSSLLHSIAGNNKSKLPSAPGIKSLTVRTLSGQSNSTKASSRDRTRAPTMVGCHPTIKSQRTFQLSRTASYTSSIRRLKMGKSPNVTPDESATYKVKRSPSAESEEFLKIDISIRGGTSYLPSEARRIHTPPLPEEGLRGKRRGFFFDYNAPLNSEERFCAKREERATIQRPILRDELTRRSVSQATTIDRKTYNQHNQERTRTGHCHGGEGWYETQLAKLDAFELELTDVSEDSMSSTEEERQEAIRELSERKHDSEQVRTDYSIPEHLPSSPLCPTHIRYWRVIKGREVNIVGAGCMGLGLIGVLRMVHRRRLWSRWCRFENWSGIWIGVALLRFEIVQPETGPWKAGMKLFQRR